MGASEIDRLKHLLKRPENKTCADCNTKQPRWASINIGCFICIRCSGIHRSIGVHISKVRSVTLDEWQPAWVDTMEQWGNKKVNQIYEARLGNARKPDASSSDREAEQYIRQKYEHRAFMAKEAAVRKSKVEVSSEEESESGDDSESSDSSSDESEQAPTQPVSKRKAAQPVQRAKATKPDSDLVTKFEKTSVSSTTESFAKFDQASVAKPTSSDINSNDFGQFGDFFGAETKPINSASASASASASNDKDFIMSLFQTPMSQPDGTGFGPGPTQSGPYNIQATTSNVPPYMQGPPPSSSYSQQGMASSNYSAYPPFGPAPTGMMPPYPPQMMNTGPVYAQQQQSAPASMQMQYGQGPQQTVWPPQGPYQ